MHRPMFTVFYFYSHKVWTWYCRVVCRTVRGSEWESYRHWRNVRTPSQSLSSLVLRRLYTLAWPSRDTSDTSLSFIFWAVYLFVHWSRVHAAVMGGWCNGQKIEPYSCSPFFMAYSTPKLKILVPIIISSSSAFQNYPNFCILINY